MLSLTFIVIRMKMSWSNALEKSINSLHLPKNPMTICRNINSPETLIFFLSLKSLFQINTRRLIISYKPSSDNGLKWNVQGNQYHKSQNWKKTLQIIQYDLLIIKKKEHSISLFYRWENWGSEKLSKSGQFLGLESSLFSQPMPECHLT